jgi:hypothetical protein
MEAVGGKIKAAVLGLADIVFVQNAARKYLINKV